MSAALQLTPEDMTREERVRVAYQAGRLRYKMAPHQLGLYDAFERWDQKRQTREHLDWCASIGAQFDNMFMLRCARRTRKTTFSLTKGVEATIRFANTHGKGAYGQIAIPVQKKVGGVLVPLTKVIFADAPKGYFPEHRTTGGGEHEHLYIPAVEGRIRLVGIDHHPDALRGSFLDFWIGTEIGFADEGFYEAYLDAIQLQFQGRPHAWSIIESSEPSKVDHDFNRHFKPDAQIRGCFFSQTIRDNTTLTEQEIADEIRRSGGPDSPTTKRELFNQQDVDPEEKVVPHFVEDVHVVDPADYPMPPHALAYEGYDPGTSDPLGYVAGYLDYMRQQFVIQFAFMKAGMSTGELVDDIVRPTELALWGTELETVKGRDTKRDEEMPILLQRIAGAQQLYDGTVWDAPRGSLTYWDKNSWSLKANPIGRISDTHARFILDLNRDYALSVRAAEKEPGSAEADLEYLDELFRRRHDDGRPLIVILRNGKTDQLIQQLRSGMWKFRDDVHKLDWQRSKLLGHLDCIAALKYMVRDIRWKRDPRPPEVRDVHRNNLHVPKELMPPGAKAPQPIAAPAGPRMSLGARLGLQNQGARPRFR
jgi:hypothetical protein